MGAGSSKVECWSQVCTAARKHGIAVCTACRIPKPPHLTGSDDWSHASGEREQLRSSSSTTLRAVS